MATPRPYSDLKHAQRLWFLVVAHSDLIQAAKAADAAMTFHEIDDLETRFALTEAAIVRFARPFCRCLIPQQRAHGAPNPPQLSTKLPADFIPSDLPGGHSVLQAVMKRRDRVVAHSEIEFKPIRLSRHAPGHGQRWNLETLLQDVSDYNLKQLSRVARVLAAKAASEVDALADQLFSTVGLGETAVLQFEREGQAPIIPQS